MSPSRPKMKMTETSPGSGAVGQAQSLRDLLGDPNERLAFHGTLHGGLPLVVLDDTCYEALVGEPWSGLCGLVGHVVMGPSERTLVRVEEVEQCGDFLDLTKDERYVGFAFSELASQPEQYLSERVERLKSRRWSQGRPIMCHLVRVSAPDRNDSVEPQVFCRARGSGGELRRQGFVVRSNCPASSIWQGEEESELAPEKLRISASDLSVGEAPAVRISGDDLPVTAHPRLRVRSAGPGEKLSRPDGQAVSISGSHCGVNVNPTPSPVGVAEVRLSESVFSNLVFSGAKFSGVGVLTGESLSQRPLRAIVTGYTELDKAPVDWARLEQSVRRLIAQQRSSQIEVLGLYFSAPFGKSPGRLARLLQGAAPQPSEGFIAIKRNLQRLHRTLLGSEHVSFLFARSVPHIEVLARGERGQGWVPLRRFLLT